MESPAASRALAPTNPRDDWIETLAEAATRSHPARRDHSCDNPRAVARSRSSVVFTPGEVRPHRVNSAGGDLPASTVAARSRVVKLPNLQGQRDRVRLSF